MRSPHSPGHTRRRGEPSRGALGRGGVRSPAEGFARFGTRETLKRGRCFGDAAAASVQAHAYSPHPPFPPLRRKRLNIALALAQVDAEHSIESGQSDNFVTWHIRQFMDDPAKTTSLFYQHVADRKAAAEQVYAPRPPPRPLPRLFSVFCSVCFFYCVFAGARRLIRWHSFRGIRLTRFLRCLWCTRSVTQLAQPIKTDGFWRQPQNNWSTIHSREVKSNPYAAAVANLEKHS